MQDQSRNFNVQVSYSIQNLDELDTKIADLATEYEGILDELILVTGENLIVNFTFSNHKKLIEFVAKCIKELKIKATDIEINEENSKKLKFIQDQIYKQILSFKERRNRNRKGAIIIKFLSLTLASLTTILLGINGLNTSNKVVLQNLAFTFSAVATLLASWDAFFNYRGLCRNVEP